MWLEVQIHHFGLSTKKAFEIIVEMLSRMVGSVTVYEVYFSVTNAFYWKLVIFL